MIVIFTDLDGTLLNHENYDFNAARSTLLKLKDAGIPVVPVTSKTRCEVEHLIDEVGISGPFVVENGSGIFLPKDCSIFLDLQDAEILDDRYVLVKLGCTYFEARQALRTIEKSLSINLSGFGDLTEAGLRDLTALSPEDVKKALTREFTEPFVQPEQPSLEILRNAAHDLGFRLLQGGRFCHLLAKGAGKGKAVQYLVQFYRNMNPNTEILSMGLGDSPNDIEMLEVVDFPVIIPGKSGEPNPALKARGWKAASLKAPEGWAQAVEECVFNGNLSFPFK